MPALLWRWQLAQFVAPLPIPAVLYAGAASQALIPVAALRHGRALPSVRRWIIVWAVLLLAYDALSLVLALQNRRNLWIGDVVGPIEVATVLIALALCHPKGTRRQVVLAVIPIFMLVWGILLVFVEADNSFSTIANPLKSLVVLVASVTTLLLAIRTEEGSLAQQDWFWITIGLALKYGADAAIEPMSRVVLDTNPEVVMFAYKLKSLVSVVASLVIARGILCPIPPPRHSSGHTSPASSPSPSSSARSARPW